jgi:DNA-binding NarL/FixJ family response regulator
MKVILVGPPPDRDHLRRELQEWADIVAEHDTLADARVDNAQADAIVVATPLELRAEAGDVEQLTAREVQVLELLAEGLPNKAIAMRLGISDQTVKFHVAAVLGKLGAANRTDAVRRAIRRGLITL